MKANGMSDFCRFFSYPALAFAAVFLAVPALAQTTGSGSGNNSIPALCPEMLKPVYSRPQGSGVGGVTQPQDDTYLNSQLTYQNVWGVRPPRVMPMKTTPRITDLTAKFEYLYRSADDRANVYSNFGTGVQGSTRSLQSLDGLIGPNGCNVPGTEVDGKTVTADANSIALQDDNMPMDADGMRRSLIDCANQYILAFSNNPKVLFDPQGAPPGLLGRKGNDELSGLPSGPQLCQPLKLQKVPAGMEEYNPSTYMYGRAPVTVGMTQEMERVSETINLHELTTKHYYDPEQRKNLIGAAANEKGATYERILDPSHPFSPRFDYDYSDRDMGLNMKRWGRALFWYQYGYSLPQCAIACAGVPVDVLRFRAPEFNQCVSERISINALLGSLDPTMAIPPLFIRLFIRATLEMEGKFPVCSTRFDQPDRAPEICQAWLKAKGAPLTFDQCCEKVRAPVIPTNLLKIRTNNAQNFPKGTPRGYSFKEYFDKNMPYMRWWDTGTSADKSDSLAQDDQTGAMWLKSDPFNTYGSLDAIVGVGREKGQSCMYGGGDESSSSGGAGETTIQIPIPPGLISGPPKGQGLSREYANYAWGELKLYQARTRQKFHLSCLGQYEKLFKTGTAEDFVLSKAGRQFMGLYGKPEDAPLGWRGYVGAPSQGFPNFNSGGQLLQGLDNAQAGDIIIFDDPAVYKRLPHVMYVERAVHESQGLELPYIVAESHNNGKFPDACGVTDAFGVLQSRTMYKPGKSQNLYEQALAQLRAQNILTEECTDPLLKSCIEPNWGNAKIWRPNANSTGGN